MGRRKQTPELVRGHATHRRTEGDYMNALLETVTVEDWRTVINTAKTAAKAGDPQARAWLASYLMGRPDAKAPTPLTVVVQQLSGNDPVVEKLAKPLIDREKYPLLHANDGLNDHIRAAVAAELGQKVREPEIIENAAPVRLTDESGD